MHLVQAFFDYYHLISYVIAWEFNMCSRLPYYLGFNENTCSDSINCECLVMTLGSK